MIPRALLMGQIFVVGCGARTDLGGTATPSPEGGAPTTSAVTCKPGYPMKVLASLGASDVVYALRTDGTSLYEDFGSAFGSMSAHGGPIAMLTSSQTYLSAPWSDGVYFVGNGLEWIRHDGTGRHVVLPTAGFVVPPVMYAINPPGTAVTEYSLEDGSSHELASTDTYPGGYGMAATDRYLHVIVERSVDVDTVRFLDRRIDRVDGSVHDVQLLTMQGPGPGVCDLSGVAPDAACSGELCVFDESDSVVTLPIPHACQLLVDDEWAYYALPAGFSRVGLRTGTLETLIPNAIALAAAEANGCLYVDAVFTAPGSQLVRIPR